MSNTSSSAHRATRDLAAALRRQAGSIAQQPAARGADWRPAVVATVGTDGTVTTTDGIVARRLGTYSTPTVGDTILVSVNAGGAWVALGRFTPATTAGNWQPLPLNTGWTAWGSPYYSPSYCLWGDGTASLCGLAKAPASTTGAATVGTLPVEARPAFKVRFWTEVLAGVGAVLDINANGTIQIGDYSGTATWTALDPASHYRLA